MKKRNIISAVVLMLATVILFSGCNKYISNNTTPQNSGNVQSNAPTQSTSFDTQPQTTKETDPPQTETPVPPENDELTFGDTFFFDGLEITFGESYSFVTLENRFSEYNGADVVRVPISVHNISGETKGLNMYYYKFFGSKGTELEKISAYFDHEIGWSGKARNGATIEAYMYFLYDGDGDYYVSFQKFIENPTEVRLPITK